MKYKVIRKQNNSSMCFVCGIDNQAGLHTHFYELENGHLLGQFKGHEIHQSYPSRMHGGIISSLLDETIGRSIQSIDESVWGVTVELTVKFLKPVPLDEELWAVGYITSNKRLLFEGEGYLCTPNHEVLASCKAKYLKQSVDTIVNNQDFVKEQWIFVIDDEMPEVFDLPL
ncbi:MAG: PaaI family thioesterase [Acholeplasmataceae bacterium]|jgi:acyl-coenzyme A thioesterase PaaI-like protein|nr:PaaI family thioesterase [Acholeplasmataceae bacterium]